MTALFTRSTDAEIRAHAQSLAEALGLAPWIEDEARFDAVTALAGCGPAFVFRFIDAIACAGSRSALMPNWPRGWRWRRWTARDRWRSGRMLRPAPADRVASPGGSTREGLNVLDADDGLNTLMAATLAASERRNREMAAAARR